MEMIANPRWEDFDIKYINVSKMISQVIMTDKRASRIRFRSWAMEFLSVRRRVKI